MKAVIPSKDTPCSSWRKKFFQIGEMNAEAVGEDLGGITGDLAIGPAMVRDMVARIKELEAQVATQNP